MTDLLSGKRRYLAAFLPLLPAERIARTTPAEARDGPYALVEKVGGAMRLAAVDAQALHLGLQPGLTLADSRARVPALIGFDHDPLADLELLEWLADGCERYTPMAAIDPPQGLVLDITGCVHGFAGEEGLAQDLAARFKAARLTARLALGDTPDMALAAARYAVDAPEQLPVEALRIEAESHLSLRRAGLKTLGDLAARPRSALAARFGAIVPTLLARLLGEEDPHISPRRALPPVKAEARFAEPIGRVEFALEHLARLVAEAGQVLEERPQGGRRFEAALFRSDGHVARLAVETGQPSRDPALLDRLFRERIDALADPIDPGFGFDMIRLSVPVVEPLATEQLQLEGGAVAEAEIAQLVDRLSVRLGKGRVRRFVSVDTHIPEQAALELPAGVTKACREGWDAPESDEPPERPFHLFDPPQRLDNVMAETPDGHPVQFRWRRATHEVKRYEGPERIAPEWWVGGHESKWGSKETRDYFRLEDVRGRRFWVFRDGLYIQTKKPDWYLHGLFA